MVIYGGTFDPVHNGHIKTALNVQNHFHFDEFIFLPCKIPVLKKQAFATPAQRIEMLELALEPFAKENHFKIDLTEINRETPSYMVDSLHLFRKKFGKKKAITLLMGQDSFNQLPSWHKWSELLSLANILVIQRAGLSNTPELKNWVQKYQTFDSSALKSQAQGLLYFYDAGTYKVSSSWIRQHHLEVNNLEDYLPASVLNFVQQNKLYL